MRHKENQQMRKRPSCDFGAQRIDIKRKTKANRQKQKKLLF